MAQLGDALAQAERRQEVILTLEAHRCTRLSGGGQEGGEVGVGGDVGGPRLVERVGAEVMGPVGAQRPVAPARHQVLGGVAVVDEDQTARLEPRQCVDHPVVGGELDLDPRPRADLTGEALQPGQHLRSGDGVDEGQTVPAPPHPALPPAPRLELGDGHRQVVDQLVGEDDAPHRGGHLSQVGHRSPGTDEIGEPASSRGGHLHRPRLHRVDVQQRAQQRTGPSCHLHQAERVPDPIVFRPHELGQALAEHGAHLGAGEEVSALLRAELRGGEVAGVGIVQGDAHELLEGQGPAAVDHLQKARLEHPATIGAAPAMSGGRERGAAVALRPGPAALAG